MSLLIGLTYDNFRLKKVFWFAKRDKDGASPGWIDPFLSLLIPFLLLMFGSIVTSDIISFAVKRVLGWKDIFVSTVV